MEILETIRDDADCWYEQWETEHARLLWIKQIQKERVLIEKRRQILSSLWSIAEGLKSIWLDRMQEKSKQRKHFTKLIAKFNGVNNLSSKSYRILFRGVSLAKCMVITGETPETTFFKNLTNLVKNEKELFSLAADPLRQFNVFQKAIVNLLSALKWW